MTAHASTGDTWRGFAFALAAYMLWGGLPLYLKLIDHIPVAEVLAHRVVWSVPIALAVLLALGRTNDLRQALRAPRTLAMAGVTAALVSVNWGVYLYAIVSNQAVEAALGYFINPLFSIFLGAVLLREKLSPRQWAAVALAAAAVALLTWRSGSLPVLALALTCSWGFYAFFKRALPIGPNQGFTLEVMLLTPLALGYLAWLGARGEIVFATTGLRDTVLLLGCGVITAVPLMLYANGAKLLRLSTIGIMQYLTPSMVLLLAVLVFDEPFGQTRAIAFSMIWAALILYTSEMVRRRR